MDIFTSYATDPLKEQNGVWQQVGDARFLVARSGNRENVRLLRTLVEKHQQDLDSSDKALAEKVNDDVTIQVLAQTILLGWEGVTYQGQAFPYSRENAAKALQHRDFRIMIAGLSDSIDAYRMKEEVAQGNG